MRAHFVKRGFVGTPRALPNAPAFVRGSICFFLRALRAGIGLSVPGPMLSSEGLLTRDVDCA